MEWGGQQKRNGSEVSDRVRRVIKWKRVVSRKSWSIKLVFEYGGLKCGMGWATENKWY